MSNGVKVTTSADVQSAVDDLAEQLNASVLIEDEKQHPIWWCTRGEVDPIRQATVLYRNVEPEVADVVRRFKLREATSPIRTPELPELGMWPRVAMPVSHEEAIVGYVWVVDREGNIPEEEFVKVLDLAKLASAQLGNAASETLKEEKLREGLIDLLLHGPNENAAKQLAQLEKIPVDSKVQVDVYGKLGGWRLPGGYLAHIVTIQNRIATSGAGLPLVELAEAFRRARLTELAIKAGAQLANNSWDDLGPWRLIVEAPSDLLPKDIFSGLDLLLDPANSDLLETARSVLDNGGDITTVAKKLFLHRTTLYYRIDRILELTGIDLKDSSNRVQLQLALWLAAFQAIKH